MVSNWSNLVKTTYFNTFVAKIVKSCDFLLFWNILNLFGKKHSKHALCQPRHPNLQGNLREPPRTSENLREQGQNHQKYVFMQKNYKNSQKKWKRTRKAKNNETYPTNMKKHKTEQNVTKILKCIKVSQNINKCSETYDFPTNT